MLFGKDLWNIMADFGQGVWGGRARLGTGVGGVAGGMGGAFGRRWQGVGDWESGAVPEAVVGPRILSSQRGCS